MSPTGSTPQGISYKMNRMIEMHAFQSVWWWAVQVLWAVPLTSKRAPVQGDHHLRSLLRAWLGRALGLWKLSGESGQS